MKMGMKGVVQEVLQVWCRKCGRHGAGSVAVNENGYERCGAGRLRVSWNRCETYVVE